ncbi:Protein of unknown function [Gryllus bimaculatus]|nr:Protein of unknown function [Gryllus bimaculatus]
MNSTYMTEHRKKILNDNGNYDNDEENDSQEDGENGIVKNEKNAGDDVYDARGENDGDVCEDNREDNDFFDDFGQVDDGYAEWCGRH